MHDYKHRAQVLRLAQAEWDRVRSKRAPYDFPKDGEADEFIVRAMAYFQHRGFMADTEHLRRQISGIHALAMPKYIILRPPNGDPTLELTDNGLTEDMKRSVEHLQAMIRAIAEDWGLTLAVPVDALA